MILGQTVPGETLEHAASDVWTRRILHCVVVGERNILQNAPITGAVERGPSAIVVLHRQQPARATASRRAIRIAARAHQRHYDHGRVVAVGELRVVILEEPSTGRGGRVEVRHPIARNPTLFRHQPLGRPRHFRVEVVEATISKRVQRDAGVPHWRQARLHAHRRIGACTNLNEHAIEFALGAHDQRMRTLVAKRVQHNLPIDHRRENRANSAFASMRL